MWRARSPSIWLKDMPVQACFYTTVVLCWAPKASRLGDRLIINSKVINKPISTGNSDRTHFLFQKYLSQKKRLLYGTHDTAGSVSFVHKYRPTKLCLNGLTFAKRAVVSFGSPRFESMILKLYNRLQLALTSAFSLQAVHNDTPKILRCQRLLTVP